MASKGALIVRFIGDTKDLDRSFKKTQGVLGKFGKFGGFLSLTAAATGFLKVGSDYSASLNKIQALSGVTDSRLKDVSKTLESQSGQFAKMGQTTGDAADGMVELIKAGMGVKSAMKAVSATMVLAKAGELSVAEAASLTSNTLNVFKMKASEAADVANILANAANVSSADVSDLRQALAMAGNVAASSGASLKQTAAMLAELSNAGMQGSDAGTSLKTMLLSLQAPSSTASKGLKALGINVFDASGKMRPIGKVLADTTKALAGLNDQERATRLKQIFGTDAYRAAKVIFGNGSAELRKYTKAVGEAGAAQKLAEANSKGFMGSLRQLKAETISAAQAAYRDLEPALDSLAQKATKFVAQMRSGEGAGGDFVAMLKAAADAGKAALAFIEALPGPVKKYGVQAALAAIALSKLNSMTSRLGSSLVMPIARTKQMYAEMTYAETRMQRVTAASRALGGMLRQVGGAAGMMAMVDGAKRSNKALGALELTAGGAAIGFAVGGPLGAGIGAAAGGLIGLYKAANKSTGAVKVALPAFQEYAQTLDGVAASASKATREMVLQRLESSGLLEATQKLGLSDRTAVNAIMGNRDARMKLAEALRHSRGLTDEQKAALEREAGAVAKSRQKQLEHNVALAQNREELKKAKKALADFMDSPAAKKVTLDTSQARAQLSALSRGLREALGLTRDLNTAGAGGVDVLLGQTSKPKRNATGTQSFRGGWTYAGEHGRELIKLPGGSKIFPAGQSAQMMTGGRARGGTITHVVEMRLNGRTIRKLLLDDKQNANISLGLD